MELNYTQYAQLLQENRTAVFRRWSKKLLARLWYLNKNNAAPKSMLRTITEEAYQQVAAYLENPEQHSQRLQTLSSAAQQNVSRTSLFSFHHDMELSWSDIHGSLSLLEEEVRELLVRNNAPQDVCDLCAGTIACYTVQLGMKYFQMQADELAAQQQNALQIHHLNSRFLTDASHDLRTPLTAVLGFLELLQEGTYGPLNSSQSTVIGHIENSAHQLLENLNNLLDVLRIKQGVFKLTSRPCSWSSTVHQIFSIVQPVAARKNIALTICLPKDASEIIVDEGLLRHIIHQMLTVTIRATPEGGSVSIEAEMLAAELCITLKDSAIHLPDELLHSLPGALPVRADHPARGLEGWETGIALVQRYLQILGGGISTQNISDEGVKFILHIPVKQSRTP